MKTFLTSYNTSQAMTQLRTKQPRSGGKTNAAPWLKEEAIRFSRIQITTVTRSKPRSRRYAVFAFPRFVQSEVMGYWFCFSGGKSFSTSSEYAALVIILSRISALAFPLVMLSLDEPGATVLTTYMRPSLSTTATVGLSDEIFVRVE